MVEILGQSVPIILLTLGVILTIAEAIAPGAHLIVLGVALIMAGLVGLALGGLLPAVLLTAVLALTIMVTGAIALFAYRELDIYGGKGSGRTKDSRALRGATGRVTSEVTPTSGEIKLDRGGFNPHYQARSVSGRIAQGKEVFVIDPGGGNVLTVESLTETEDDIDRELARGRAALEEDSQSERAEYNG